MEALLPNTSTSSALPTLDPIIKIENELENEDQMEEESCQLHFSHFLDSANQGIEPNEDGNYYSAVDVHIKEEVGEGEENGSETPFSNTTVETYIKPEPQSDDVQKKQSQFEMENSNSPYSAEGDNSKDSDWNEDCKKTQRLSKRQKTERILFGSSAKVMPKRPHRIVKPAESGRVLNAFQNIVDNLCLTKPKRRTKGALQPTSNKKEGTSGNTCTLISDNRSPRITYPSQSTRKIKCAFCSEDFERRCFNQHYRNFFHPFQCSGCSSTFLDRKSCTLHVQTAHKNTDVVVVAGNFLASNYNDPLSPTLQQENCHWFKCRQCQTHLENEYLLIYHYRCVHPVNFSDTENFLGPSSMRAYTTELSGVNFWGSKIKLPKCKVPVVRVENEKNTNQLFSTSTASQNDIPRPRRGRHTTKGKKPLVRSCGLCSKGFTTNRSYQRHMTSIHNVSTSTQHRITLSEIASTRFEHIELIIQPAAATTTSETCLVETLPCVICNQQFNKSEDLTEHYRSHPELATNPPSSDISRSVEVGEESELDILPLTMVKAEHMSHDEKDFSLGQVLEPEEIEPQMGAEQMSMKTNSNIIPPNPRARKNFDPLQEDHICVECFQIFASELLLQRHVRQKHVTATDVSKRLNDTFSKIFGRV